MNARKAVEHRRVRPAFGQGGVDDGARRREPCQLRGIVHGAGSVRLSQFARIIAQLLGKSAPPGDLDDVAALPDRTGAPRDAARDEPEWRP